jgi:hypothetical protein
MPAATASRRASVVALIVFVGATLAVHGVIAWWSPVQGSAWQTLLRAQRGGSWLAGVRQTSELCSALVAHATSFHVIVTPLAGLAVLVGTFTLAARRLPDPRRWDDVLGIALVSSLIWVVVPRAGVMWFHRPYATQIVGAALVVWLAAAFRCRWRARTGGDVDASVGARGEAGLMASAGSSVAMFVAGWLAATTTLQLAVAALVGVGIALARLPRSERQRWMWGALAGVALGAIVCFVRWRWADSSRLRLDASLAALSQRAGDAAVVITAIGLVVLGRLWHATRRGLALALPDSGEAGRWLAAWLGLVVASLLGPRAPEAALLPASLALCIAVLPSLTWIAHARIGRWMLVAFVVAVHAVAWTRALPTYRALGREYRARMAAITRTPPHQIAVVAPYTQLEPSFWAYGEDWDDAELRETLGQELWQLRDIELVPTYRGLERSADLELALELGAVTADQRHAAQPPAAWPRNLARARRALAGVIARLPATASVRLRVTDVDFTTRASRPVFAAWAEPGSQALPAVRRSRPDETGVVTLTLAAALAAELPEAWVVGPSRATRVTCPGGRCRIEVTRAERTVVVLCNPERCLAADAWVPWF